MKFTDIEWSDKHKRYVYVGTETVVPREITARYQYLLLKKSK